MGTREFRRQIYSQPDAVAKALAWTAVPDVDWSRSVVFTGVGSSLHACMTAAAWANALSRGAVRPSAVDALELVISGGVRAGEQLIVVSHRGTKRFTNELLATAQAAGARTILVTGNGVADPPAETVLRTCDDETASAHTVSYTTALAVLGKLVATVGGPFAEEFLIALASAPDAIRRTLSLPAPTGIAARLRGIEPILIAGSGIDAATAKEAALKYKESTFAWAEAIGVEVALHGTPACFRADMAALLIRPSHDDGGRSQALAALLQDLGAPVVQVAADGGDVPFVSTHTLIRPLVSVVAIQRLVAEISDLADGDPDHTRTLTEPWSSATAKVVL